MKAGVVWLTTPGVVEAAWTVRRNATFCAGVETCATSCVGEMSDAKPPTLWGISLSRVPGTMRSKETGLK